MSQENPSKKSTIENPNEDEFFIGWHGHNVAKLGFNGSNWSFNYASGWMLPLSGGHYEHPGEVPTFILNLMPETTGGAANRVISLGEVLKQSERFLSNIVISKDEQKITTQAPDKLEGRLETFSCDTIYQGKCADLPSMNGGVLMRMDSMVESNNVPRMSGCQAKMPCNLSEDGVLAPAASKSFSHILKFPGFMNDGKNLRGAIEWASMSMAKGGGVNTCEFSLVELPGSNVLAYVAERFDVQTDKSDKRLLFCEDFCSSMGSLPGFKYGESIEDMIDALRRLSTQPETDCLDFFRLVYANKILENGDFHLKNAAILREVSPDLRGFSSTVLAPAYDIMNTRFFNPKPLPPYMPETMALNFEGGNENYSLKHLASMAKLLGIDKSKAMDIMYDVASGIAAKASEIGLHPPEIFDQEKFIEERSHVVHACNRAVYYCNKDFPEISAEFTPKANSPKP